jgi:hypothetical protein
LSSNYWLCLLLWLGLSCSLLLLGSDSLGLLKGHHVFLGFLILIIF